MKKVIFLVFSVFVCVALLAAGSGTVDPTDETSAVPSNSEVSNLLPDNSDSSAEPSENSTASEDVSGEESSAVVENPDNDLPVLLEVRTEIGDKMTVDYLEYDNGNTFEKVIIYEDDEKTIRESETLKKDDEVLSVTEYKNGEQSKSTYFIEGEILFYKEAFEVSAEEADYFGSTGENTYDSSNRLLKSHYGKSAVYYLEDGEVYYQCYDDPSDPWDMKLYNGFTEFYAPVENATEAAAVEGIKVDAFFRDLLHDFAHQFVAAAAFEFEGHIVASFEFHTGQLEASGVADEIPANTILHIPKRESRIAPAVCGPTSGSAMAIYKRQ